MSSNIDRKQRRAHKQNRLIYKRLPVLLLLPLLIGLSVESFHMLSSAVVDGQTREYLNFWQKKLTTEKDKFSLSEEAVATARAGAARAALMVPNSPEYQAAIGKVESWVVTQAQRTGGQIDQSHYQEGLDAYRQAIRLRPAWPYVWADFAMAKARAGELDQEFFNALTQATRFGPWEQSVMDTVTQLGLWYRNWLPVSVKGTIDDNVKRYAQTYPYGAMAIARLQNKREIICPLLNKPEWFRKDCPPVAGGQS